MPVIEIREPHHIDEEYWYNIQFDNIWYSIKACCRVCATRMFYDRGGVLGQLDVSEMDDMFRLIHHE